jgi:hypothetical protein
MRVKMDSHLRGSRQTYSRNVRTWYEGSILYLRKLNGKGVNI